MPRALRTVIGLGLLLPAPGAARDQVFDSAGHARNRSFGAG